MFEVQNVIDWNAAKKHIDNYDDYEIYYDRKDYSRLLVFKEYGTGLPSHLNDLFGGDWRWVDIDDIKILDEHYEALNKKARL